MSPTPDNAIDEHQLRKLTTLKKQLYRHWYLVPSREAIEGEIIYDGGSYVVLRDRTRLDIMPDRHLAERETWEREM